MLFNKKIQIISLAMILFTGCNSFEKTKKNVLIVGTNSGFPPYETLNESGELEGFDIDVARCIAKKMGKSLEIKDMAFDSLIIALKQGKIDLILAGVSITESRKQEIELIHYSGKPLNCLTLLFWKKTPENIKEINDLAQMPSKTVCVQAGTIQDELLSKYSFLDIKHLENVSDLILDIKYGGSIAAVIDYAVAVELQTKMSEIKLVNFALKPEEQTLGMGIGIKKENISLIQKLNNVIGEMKNDATLLRLEQKWFKKIGGK